MPGFTDTQANALRVLCTAAATVSSWDFASGTVAWLRRNGFVTPKDTTPAGQLHVTQAGRLAQARGDVWPSHVSANPSSVVRINGGHREREALRLLLEGDRCPDCLESVPFQAALDTTLYDPSRDEFTFPDGTRMTVQEASQ